MTQAELNALPSNKLFACCASYFDDDRYWDEFVRRFNPCLTNIVYQAYQRLNIEALPSVEVASELLQEIYLKILNDKCAALQRFRGASDLEAEVYLLHIAINATIDHLRRQRSLNRRTPADTPNIALILE
jgi:DNA-directed RNA polymerase specialized sigma24 family protein